MRLLMVAGLSGRATLLGGGKMTNRFGDWRIWVGSITSVLWIGFGLVYVFGVIGWEAFLGQGMDVLGSFLEGAFAPLAFLWLVSV